MNKKTAKKLESLRREKGFTQDELAAKLGISRQAISKWESAESSPDTDHLIALSKLYGVSIDELIGAPDTKNADLKAEREAFFGMDGRQNAQPKEKRPASAAASFPFPVLVVAIFLFIGFVFNTWHPTWLIFLSIPIYYYIVTWAENGKNGQKRSALALFPYPLLVVIAFLGIGFFTGIWNPTWLLFLTIPLYFIIVAIFSGDKGAANAWYPIFIVLLYLALGFFFNLWHPTWLLFLTVPLYYILTGKKKNLKGVLHAVFPIIIAGIYLVMGFYYHLWHPGWMIFMTIPLWSWLIEAIMPKEKKDDTLA